MGGGTAAVPNPGRAKQILASVVAAILSLLGGMSQGWQSPMSLKLQQDDSPVGKLDNDELALLATLPGYYGLVVAFLLGFLAQRFGRKIALYTVSTVTIVGGAMLVLGSSKLYLYIGRVLSSTAIAGLSLPTVFISETAHESIRGSLLALCTFQLNFGILVSYTAGAKLPYKVFNAILVILPAVFTVLLFFIPETPLFLADRGRTEDAKKSMVWYRGGDQRVAEQELQKIISAKNENVGNASFKEILKSKVTRLAMIISVSEFFFQVLSGIQAILNYVSIIFKESGSLLSPDDSSIIVALILLGSSVLSMLLMDRLGRKLLLYFSFAGDAIAMTLLAIFLYAKMKGAEVAHLGWIPISCVSLFAFTYGVGLASVPGAIMNEVSPTNIRPTVSVMVSLAAYISMTLVVQTFPYLDDNLGLYSVFVFPAVINVAGIIFTLFLVPETKGKALLEIQEELKNR